MPMPARFVQVSRQSTVGLFQTNLKMLKFKASESEAPLAYIQYPSQGTRWKRFRFATTSRPLSLPQRQVGDRLC